MTVLNPAGKSAPNPFECWDRHHGDKAWAKAESLFETDKPVVGAFDTETDGLHIIQSQPFLIVFGWLFRGKEYGRVFTFPPSEQNMQRFHKLAKKLKLLIAWNIKFDLHMLRNAGWEYTTPNLCEGMALARLSVEALSASDKDGDSLSLKHMAKRYVHPTAADAEAEIKKIKTKLKNERRKPLKAILRTIPVEGEVDKRGNPIKWSLKRIEEYEKNIELGREALPTQVRELLEEFEEPTYKDIYHAAPEKMVRYAQDDVVATLAIYCKTRPMILERNQKEVLKRENNLILPLYQMERTGLKVNRQYLMESREKLKKAIIGKRKRLCELAQAEVTVGQHVKLKEIFLNRWGLALEKTDKKHINQVFHTEEGEAKEFAGLIRQLRRLEKWISVYCDRVLEMSEFDGRFYTQINQCGAVSGRVSSDAQQFPKDRILTDEGVQYEEKNGPGTAPREMEIFYPRRAFEPTDRGQAEGYTSIYFLDFSQIELRNQAHYTILVNGGDPNLCRAYMPFGCKDEKGNPYDYRDPQRRQEWDQKKWFLPDGTPWVETDVHGETTHNALVELRYRCLKKYKTYESTEKTPKEATNMFGFVLDEKAFKKARYKGKTFNFMANYGGGVGAAMDTLEIPEIIAKALLNGYRTAFPGVTQYQQTIYKAHAAKGYVHNHYGRRYYLRDNRKAYKLANYVIQGTATGDLMKECIIEIEKFLRPYRTRMILTVHDELQFEVWKGEEHLVPQILGIMQDHPWHLVPIVSDPEVTYTNWAEAKDVEIQPNKEESVA